MPYLGRFAPTPSGFLHFGSLVAALASYLDARAAGGTWLVRIEDLDPPREMPGARDAILSTLDACGLHADAAPVLQSQRHAAYEAAVQQLLANGLAYACRCSRKQLEGHSRYPGTCRNAQHSLENAAIRVRVPDETAADVTFIDRVQGHFTQNIAREGGDFIIKRRDGLYAYQLAVVVDDGWQGVTDIVRGADLLDSTPRQRYLQTLLGFPAPRYLHIPLLLQPDGHKLGKSYRSPPVATQHAPAQVLRALRALGQCPPESLQHRSVAEVLAWGVAHWNVAAIPPKTGLDEASLR